MDDFSPNQTRNELDGTRRRSAIIATCLLTPIIIFSLIALTWDFNLEIIIALPILIFADISMFIIIFNRGRLRVSIDKIWNNWWLWTPIVVALVIFRFWFASDDTGKILDVIGDLIIAGVAVLIGQRIARKRLTKSQKLDTTISNSYAVSMENTQATNDQVTQPASVTPAPVATPTPVVAPAPVAMPVQATEAPNSSLGMWSLIISIVALAGTIFSMLIGLLGILSLVFGVKGMKTSARGMAIAGVVISIIAIAIPVIAFTIGFVIGFKQAL